MMCGVFNALTALQTANEITIARTLKNSYLFWYNPNQDWMMIAIWFDKTMAIWNRLDLKHEYHKTNTPPTRHYFARSNINGNIIFISII